MLENLLRLQFVFCSQLNDCPEKHLLIGELASTSTGAEDFDLLAEEVLSLV